PRSTTVATSHRLMSQRNGRRSAGSASSAAMAFEPEPRVLPDPPDPRVRVQQRRVDLAATLIRSGRPVRRHRSASIDQIEFVNLVVNHLTAHGAMEAAQLYESPFTDLTPRGPEGLFDEKSVDRLVEVLHG